MFGIQICDKYKKAVQDFQFILSFHASIVTVPLSSVGDIYVHAYEGV